MTHEPTGQERALKEALDALRPFAEIVDEVKESASALQNDRDDFMLTQIGGYKVADLYTDDFVRAAQAYERLAALPHQPATDEGEAVTGPASGERTVAMDLQAEYRRGIYDAKVWLRDQQHKSPPDSLWHAAAILADRMDVALLSTPTSQPPAAETRLRERLGDGEFFADGDKFDLIFRPGGGNYGGADKIVARMACGDTAHWLPGLVAQLLNAALTQPEPTAQQGGDR